MSVSLWRLGANQTGPIAVVGATPALDTSAARAESSSRPRRAIQLGVIGLLGSSQRHLGYAFTSPGLTGRYVVYGESALPASRRSKFQSTSAFADLDYALYLGTSHAPRTCW